MPELPEVEVVKKSLQRDIINLTIKKVKIITLSNTAGEHSPDFYKRNDMLCILCAHC